MTSKPNTRTWLLAGFLITLFALLACSRDASRGNPLDSASTPAVEVAVTQDDSATMAIVTWTPYTGIAPFAEYLVLRNISGDSIVDTLAVVLDRGETSFIDTALVDNVPYTYRVAAVNTAGFESSSEVSTVVHGPVAPRIAYYSNLDGNMEVVSINLDGSGQVNLTNHPTDDGNIVGSGVGRLSWSPDGERIAFTSWRDGQTEVYVMSAYGTDVTRLTYHPENDNSPAWSPDGERIVFWSAGDGGVIVNPNGSGRRTVGGGLAFPSWSPDSTQIVFTTWNGTSTELILLRAPARSSGY